MICFIIGILLVQLCSAELYSATGTDLLKDIGPFSKEFSANSQMQCSALCMRESCEIFELEGKFSYFHNNIFFYYLYFRT